MKAPLRTLVQSREPQVTPGCSLPMNHDRFRSHWLTRPHRRSRTLYLTDCHKTPTECLAWRHLVPVAIKSLAASHQITLQRMFCPTQHAHQDVRISIACNSMWYPQQDRSMRACRQCYATRDVNAARVNVHGLSLKFTQWR